MTHLETTLELALPASLALAAAVIVAREALIAVLHAAAHDGWAALRARLERRRDGRRTRRGIRRDDGG